MDSVLEYAEEGLVIRDTCVCCPEFEFWMVFVNVFVLIFYSHNFANQDGL